MREVYEIEPVGTICVGQGGFRIEINDKFRPGLKELGDFGHVSVLWWAHLTADGGESGLQVERPYRSAPDTVGVFATRSPIRPNPIGLSVAGILDVDEQAGVVYLSYIDAEDGTPVIDVKPYQPSADRVREVQVPRWCAHWPRWMEDSAEFDWAGEFVNAR